MSKQGLRTYASSPPKRVVQRDTPRGTALCERCGTPLDYDYASIVWQHTEHDLCLGCELGTQTPVPSPQRSSDVRWEYRGGEYFEFFESRFDVNRAKHLLAEHSRESIDYDLACAAYLVRLRVVTTGSTKGVDLNIPIILGTYKGVLLPIDGWHGSSEPLR